MIKYEIVDTTKEFGTKRGTINHHLTYNYNNTAVVHDRITMTMGFVSQRVWEKEDKKELSGWQKAMKLYRALIAMKDG